MPARKRVLTLFPADYREDDAPKLAADIGFATRDFYDFVAVMPDQGIPEYSRYLLDQSGRNTIDDRTLIDANGFMLLRLAPIGKDILALTSRKLRSDTARALYGMGYSGIRVGIMSTYEPLFHGMSSTSYHRRLVLALHETGHMLGAGHHGIQEQNVPYCPMTILTEEEITAHLGANASLEQICWYDFDALDTMWCMQCTHRIKSTPII